MADHPLHILVVVGSPARKSSTRIVLKEVANDLTAAGCEVDILDFQKEPLPLFTPETSYQADVYAGLKSRVEKAEVLLLGTPDYHGCMSSTLKNFLDHFWKEYAGKLFATIVASHEKGLTVTDQLRTVARQCYAWSLPYGVSFLDNEDLRDGRVSSESLRQRLEMLVRDVQIYGRLLSRQRQADLAGSGPGFMARHRP